MTDSNSGRSFQVVETDRVLGRIKPGTRIFISTGVAEPRTLIQAMLNANRGNLSDLELIQLISLGDAVCLDDRCYQQYRLKTFFAGWVASDEVTKGRVDLIPCPFAQVPGLIASGTLSVDAAFIRITEPDARGWSSLSVAVDAARQAMRQAKLVVGEICPDLPRTMGDTFVHVDEFDYLVRSDQPPIHLPRWETDEVFERVAANLAVLIDDGDTIPFTFGPLYESLVEPLSHKKDLGVHSLVFTDALMELMETGAVSNRRKGVFKGKTLTSYAFGGPELYQWLHDNPFVEFQGIDVTGDPRMIGRNRRLKAILPARKVELTGNVALHAGKGNVAASPGAIQEIVAGSRMSRGGRVIFALPSRNRRGESNFPLSLNDLPNQLPLAEYIDFVVTEYGVAHLAGRTIRERALALIDVAHPDDREELVEAAKEANLLYQDQIYMTDSGALYPSDLYFTETFKDGVEVRFRPIRPSDEEQMRRLFYRFSEEAVYYRYFSPVKSMPHAKMQAYVNIDYRTTMSIVGLVGEPGAGRIIAEARYVMLEDGQYADTAFVVDEEYHGLGIATHLLNLLIKIARQRGLKGITGDVLPENKGMWKVYEKAPFPMRVERHADSYHIIIDFKPEEDEAGAEDD